MTIWDKPVFRYPRLISGWTAVEILIGLTVIAVILLLSAPGVNTLTLKHFQKKTSTNLISSLTLAQEEATRRRLIARMCPSSDGSTCRSDGNWNRGWIVFLDSNSNYSPEAVEILERHGPPNDKIRIQGQGAFTYRATFGIDGIPKSGGVTDEGIFKVCFANREPDSQDILVNNEGWIDVKKSEQICSEV